MACCFKRTLSKDVVPQSLSAEDTHKNVEKQVAVSTKDAKIKTDLEAFRREAEKQASISLNDAIIETPVVPSVSKLADSLITPTISKLTANGPCNAPVHTPRGRFEDMKAIRRASFGKYDNRHTSFGGTLGKRVSIGGPGARNAYIQKQVSLNRTSVVDLFRSHSSSITQQVHLPCRSCSFRDTWSHSIAPNMSRSSYYSKEEVDSDSGVSSFGDTWRSSIGSASMMSSVHGSRHQRTSSIGSYPDRSMVGVHGASFTKQERRLSYETLV